MIYSAPLDNFPTLFLRASSRIDLLLRHRGLPPFGLAGYLCLWALGVARESRCIARTHASMSLCSFSQFSFPFNFQTANSLVLKFGLLPLRCLVANTVLAIFDIYFRSKVILRFVPKNGPKMTCGRVFRHNFISKANLKNPEQAFLVHRFYLLRKQKDCLWQGRFST